MAGKQGRVYIVGAGPGDWELVTLKVLKAIQQADVIVYDFLSSSELLSFAKKGVELICVGKADGLHLFAQSRINKMLFEKAKNGKSVVRLKGGDPFVFSRGIEEALYLKKKGVEFEIIPGLTSAFSAPESFGIPLTRRGKYSSVALLTGRKSNNEPLDAPDCNTLVYLMAVANIKNVVRAVLDSGRLKNTPCAFIEKGTTSEERIITGNLSNIVDKAEEFQVKPPAVFVVGEVVNYGRKIYSHKFK